MLNTIGADIEVFLYDHMGLPISPEGAIEGTKKEPKKLKEGFFIHKDNLAVEFNVPVSRSKEEFVSNMNEAYDLIRDYIPSDMDIGVIASEEFDKEELESELGRDMGCDEEIDAWSEEIIYPPNPDHKFRTAGGHIHIGHSGDEQENIEIAKKLDYFLGLYSLFTDYDTRRRELYGKAGSFRNKEYGLEYRTLSNFWTSDPDEIGFIYDQVVKAIKGENVQDQTIKECINENDTELAKQILENDTEHKIKETQT